MERSRVAELIKSVDNVYLRFGAPEHVFGTDQDQIKEIQRQAARADLNLVPARIRHLGTEQCFAILRDMRHYIGERVEIRCRTPVRHLVQTVGPWAETEQGETIRSPVCNRGSDAICSDWFLQRSHALRLKMEVNPVDIGVRWKPAVVMEHLTDVIYESKFIFSKAFDDGSALLYEPFGEVVWKTTAACYSKRPLLRRKTARTRILPF